MSRSLFTREELTAAPPGAFRRQLRVRLQDVDAAGIVFFARVFEYFHDAFSAYLDQQDVPLAAWLAEGVLLAPIKQAEADFLAPLRFGDLLEVELVRARVEPTEATLGYRLLRLPSRQTAAVGSTRHVCVERAAAARAPLPARVAAALRRLEPDGPG